MKSKKELKKAYKEMKSPMGVFQIKNRTNNRVLIDSNIDMMSKWNRHKMELKFGSHRNRALQKDWNEAGEDNFVFEILSDLKNNDTKSVNYQNELKVLEEMVIEELHIKKDHIY